jgi:hypothetical protein
MKDNKDNKGKKDNKDNNDRGGTYYSYYLYYLYVIWMQYRWLDRLLLWWKGKRPALLSLLFLLFLIAGR